MAPVFSLGGGYVTQGYTVHRRGQQKVQYVNFGLQCRLPLQLLVFSVGLTSFLPPAPLHYIDTLFAVYLNPRESRIKHLFCKTQKQDNK